MSKTSFAALAAIAVGACFPTDGTRGEEHLGAFSFVATALEDTCLASRFGASLTFPATLSRTREILYFNGPGGTIRGTIAGKVFTVTFGGIEAIDRTCQVSRDETLSGQVETTSVSGSYLIRVIPVQGASCTIAVASRQFATLPCVVRYNVVGERTDAPDGGEADGGADGGASDGGT
jgi:hypothetical protein